MKRSQKWLTLWGIGAAAVLIAMVLTTATYAWFTANREVETDKVTAKTGSGKLELQISDKGAKGEKFTPRTDKKGNSLLALKPGNTNLMPVSTADLKTFVYCPVTENNQAKSFRKTPDESLYYHDTFYLRAVGTDLPDGSRLDLYLDDTETPIVKAPTGELLTAARLGLVIEGSKPIILTLSDVNKGEGNTIIGGTPLKKGMVLTWKDNAPVAVKDPAIPLAKAQVVSGSGSAPLATLKLKQVYRVDVYFYLEGCDPDCMSDVVGMDAASLNLAFFGMLKQ